MKPSRRNRQKRRDKRLYEELIECRRSGGGRTNKKGRQKGRRRAQKTLETRDSLPAREAIRPKPLGTFQDDNLEPLERWLQSQVGRSWEQVFSDLNKQLDTRSATGLHVLQHLWWYVDPNTKLIDGKLVFFTHWGGIRRFEPWFYVHPRTGLFLGTRQAVQKGPFPKKARWKKEKEKRKWKRKLGLEDPAPVKTIERERIELPCIRTTGKKVEVGREYFLESQSIAARIRILDIHSARYRDGSYLLLKYRILKCNLSWMEGSTGRVQSRPAQKEVLWSLFDSSIDYLLPA